MRLVVVGLCVALSGCASLSRVASYEGSGKRPVEKLTTPDGVFLMRPHPVDQAVYIQPGFGVTGKAALVSDLTLGMASAEAAYGIRPKVMRAAEAYASGRGCAVADLAQLSNVAWEAMLKCPR